MKEQNNRDKLNDALGMVDEEMVQATMLHVEGMRAAHLSRRAMIRRRVAVLAAACLSLCLVVGAMLAVPLLLADDTEPPQDAGSLAPEEDHGGEMEDEPSYVEAPIVRVVQLSATETSTISDQNVPVHPLDSGIESADVLSSSIPFLVFDCKPGETVTIKADTDCLGLINMVWEEGNRDVQIDFWKAWRWIEHTKMNGQSDSRPNVSYYTDSVTLDPTQASVVLGLRYTNPKTDVEEVKMTFTVTNEEGQITGVGSFYVGKRYLMTYGERRPHIGLPSILRSGVLGSVRFENPAVTVTEEKVNQLLDEFDARTEEVKESLNYAPVTRSERGSVARAEIIRMAIANGESLLGGGGSFSSYQDFHFITYGTGTDSNYRRQFVVLADCSWAEIQGHGDCLVSRCHLGCAKEEEQGVHHSLTVGCTLHAVDGRVYEVQLVSPDSDLETLVLIEDPTA